MCSHWVPSPMVTVRSETLGGHRFAWNETKKPRRQPQLDPP